MEGPKPNQVSLCLTKQNTDHFSSTLNSNIKSESLHRTKTKGQLLNQFKETFNKASGLPNKVFENCQRTSRVVILSKLQKLLNKDKKLKIQFSNILQTYLGNKNDGESSCEYSTKKGYYDSQNYSRVRIGQKEFLKKFLLNEIFMQKFQILFQSKSLTDLQKARKNQRSQISLQKRREVVLKMIEQYKQKFYFHFNHLTPLNSQHSSQDSQQQVHQICQIIPEVSTFQQQINQQSMLQVLFLPLQTSATQNFIMSFPHNVPNFGFGMSF